VALATAFEWQRLKAQASLLGTFVNESTGIVEDKQEYTPAVFISYQPFVGVRFITPVRLRAFYKRIFRMPTFNDLYYTDIGNIFLRPEYTTQYNLGFQYNKNYDNGIINNLNFRADAYYNEVTDKIIAVPKGNGQYRWMMMNLGYVEIRGVDVSASMGMHVGAQNFVPLQINVSVNYTYQKAQDFTNPADNDPQAGTYGSQIAYIPWHNGSAIVNTNWKTWDLNYSFIYVGERYHNSSNIRENYERPWYTHDLTIGKSFVFRKGAINRAPTRCKISAEINNVLNQQYDVVLNYPMPGRNYKIILKIDI
jgi:outer membrane cobalamin receptor